MAGRTPRDPRRILIVSADMGEGHDATGRALQEAAERLWPDCEVRWLDTLDAMGGGCGPLFRRIYVHSVESSPWLYEFFYGAVWRHRWFARAAKRFIGAWAGRRLASHVDAIRPDLVLSTYPMGSTGLAWLRRYRGLSVPTGAWVSDFNPHPSWIHAEVDLNLVMHEVAVPAAREAVPGATVIVSAPPVTRRFQPGDTATARRLLDLPADGLAAVVACGSLGFGDSGEAVRELLDGAPDVRVIVIAGRNERLRDELSARFAEEDRVQVRGWVADMPTVLRAADMVVTNAGGATALEALACGCPVLMHRPIAGHGRANAALMARAGLAKVCEEPGQLAKAAAELAGDPAQLANLRRTARRYAQAHILDDGLRALTARGSLTITRTLPPEDALFLHAETAEVPQEIGAVLVFAPRQDGTGPTRAEAAEMIANVPGVHGRLHRGTRWRRPHWDLDDSIDRSALVAEAHLGAPGGPPNLATAIDRYYAAPLADTHPCGAGLLVTGLPEGRSALLVKLHHGLGDGMAVLRGLLASTESANRVWATPPAHRVGRRSFRRTDLGRLAHGLWTLARAGRAPPDLRGWPEDPRRHHELLRLSRRRIRSVARALDITTTELLIGGFAEAVHRVYAKRADPPPTLRLMVPWSVRDTATTRAAGNCTGAVSVDLPIGPMTPARRFDLVGAQLRARVDGGVPQAAQAVVRLLGVLPPAVHARAARAAYRSTWFNAIGSVMPGPRREVRLCGCPIVEAYPLLPLAPGVHLSWGALTWGDCIYLGLTGQGEWACDLPPLALAFRAALDELMIRTGDGP